MAAPSLAAYIAGNRLSDAKLTMRGYSANNIGLGKNNGSGGASLIMAENASAISSGMAAGTS